MLINRVSISIFSLSRSKLAKQIQKIKKGRIYFQFYVCLLTKEKYF